MTRCYLKRSAKTAAALMVAFIMVLAMIDTRSRYNDFMITVEPPDHFLPNDLGGGGGRKLAVSKLGNISNSKRLAIKTNKTEEASSLSSSSSSFGLLESHSNSVGDRDTAYDGSGDLKRNPDYSSPIPRSSSYENSSVVKVQTNLEAEDNAKFTLRFWDLVDRTRKGASKPLFANMPLPYLWRPEKEHLSRDDDRVLAQLIWAMEATNISQEKGLDLEMKTIYIPDSFRWWGKTKWRSPHTLDEEDCPGNPGVLRKCAFSQSRDSMDALITVRDAFHTRDFSVPPNVLRFYFILESPIFSHATLRRNNDIMATFYRGSDVNTPYGKWVYHDPSVKFKDQEKDYAKGKTKMAAIFTSNCHPWNNRMGYVRELQKYVDVDVFGACGRKHCPRFNQKECYGMLKRDYRFYLAFENSNCRDYVTEKLFMNAFENDIIPIVLGAHPDDYKAMCPEKSYIHVEDFPSPAELAKYMIHLAENSDEYNSYFRWKDTGKFIDTNFFCRVCAMVHYADLVPPPKRKSSYSWNSEEAINKEICLPSGAWYWNSKGKTGAKHHIHPKS